MEIKLPDIGEGVHEGELVKWLVKPGDVIKVDQPVVEVMTDKATVEIPAPIGGKVTALAAKEGEIVKVGQTLIQLEAAAGGATVAAPKASTPAPAPAKPAAPAPMMAAAAPTRAAPAAPATNGFVATPGNVLATPATRRLASDLGIDLTTVPATGPNGRVTKEDLQKYSGGSGAVSAGVGTMQTKTPQFEVRQTTFTGEREKLIPFRGIRKKISEAMVRSRTTIPDFAYVDECDISELVAFRKEAKVMAEKQGVKLTYMPFIVKAVIKGLKQFPSMNAELDEAGGNIVLKNYFNIGVAVDTENGLVVPNIKNADQKSILEIAHEINVLSEKARNGKLALEEMKGGTFTITNAGNIGGMLATPIINYPETAIFGVHKISRRPVVKEVDGEEKIVPADVIWLSTSVDHRVVDGADAARFMNVVMDYLSNPKKLLLDSI